MFGPEEPWRTLYTVELFFFFKRPRFSPVIDFDAHWKLKFHQRKNPKNIINYCDFIIYFILRFRKVKLKNVHTLNTYTRVYYRGHWWNLNLNIFNLLLERIFEHSRIPWGKRIDYQYCHKGQCQGKTSSSSSVPLLLNSNSNG